MCSGGNSGVIAGGGEAALGAILSATGAGSSLGVPLILGGLGSAVGGAAAQDQINKQNDIAAAGIIKQGELQKQGENDVQGTINTVAGSNAAAQAKTSQQLNAYRQALLAGQTQTNAASPSASTTGAGKAFQSAQASASGSAKDYVNAIAGSAATTQGTQLERVGENQAMAGTAGQLGVLANTSNEDNYLTQLKIKATQQNPWLKSLGLLLQGAGMATGAAAGASAASSAASDAATSGAAAADANAGSVFNTGIGATLDNPGYQAAFPMAAGGGASAGGIFGATHGGAGLPSYLTALGH